MQAIFFELLQTWRGMLRRPGYLVLASVVLSLGIGACVAVTVLLQTVLLRPLPYPQADRLVALGEQRLGVAYRTSPQDYQHMLPLDGVTALGVASRYPVPKNISGGGEPTLASSLQVDRGLLATLGMPLPLGRNFTVEEDRPGGPGAVILSHGFWLRRYGGDRTVLGRRLWIEGMPSTIVGVLPATFDLQQVDLLLPFALPADSTDDGVNVMAIGRLAPGATASVVGAQLQTRLHALHLQWGGPFAEWRASQTFRADPLKRVLTVSSRPVLLMFLASALALLLIAWINLANLMLARILSQRQQVAIRMALGAPRLRIALPVWAEGLLISALATAGGSLLALLGIAILREGIPPAWLAGGVLQPAPWMLAEALLLALAGVCTAVFLGLWQASREVAAHELRGGGRHGASVRAGRLGRLLVIAQVGIATLLLCVSGTFLQHLYTAARTPLGFRSDGVLTFELSPIKASHQDAAAVHRMTDQLLERLGAVPGVQQVSVGTALPAGSAAQNFYLGNIHAQGQPPLQAESPQFRAVDAGFFQVFDIKARQGRVLQPADRQGSEPVAVINQQLDRLMFGGHGLGQLLQYTAPMPGGGGLPVSARIVGVIDTISPFGPLGQHDGLVYVPWAQVPAPLLDVYRDGNPLHFALRVRGRSQDYRHAVQDAVAAVASDQPLTKLLGMEEIVHATTDATRLNLLLVGVLALLALTLAAAGVHAVMSLAVAARGQEFAVRLALGSSPMALVAKVVRTGLLQMTFGLLLGLVLAALLVTTLHALVMQLVEGLVQPGVWLAVCLVLALAGLLACLLPALRAGRVDPMHALRGIERC